MADESEPTEYTYVMPFVVVKSNGGIFEDNAYAAGWEAGKIDYDLAMGEFLKFNPPNYIVRRTNLPQIDLIAMKHKLVMEEIEFEEPFDGQEEWARVHFGIYNEEL